MTTNPVEPDRRTDPPASNADRRQSPAAAAISRGTARLLRCHGFACVPEVSLANGRRADLMAVNEAGDIWLIEIKSSIADFRSDAKWPQYREYCDQFLFAVAPDFPRALVPEETGLIIADRYGGELVRLGPHVALSAARRKAVTIRLARTASFRLHAAADPDWQG